MRVGKGLRTWRLMCEISAWTRTERGWRHPSYRAQQWLWFRELCDFHHRVKNFLCEPWCPRKPVFNAGFCGINWNEFISVAKLMNIAYFLYTLRIALCPVQKMKVGCVWLACAEIWSFKFLKGKRGDSSQISGHWGYFSFLSLTYII